MKNKKGFTLIEIIVCIALITVIGVSSFFGVRLISKNIKISKLEQLSDRIIQAAEIYIETNKEAYNQLYKNKNSVVIPLNTLVDEGFLDLSATTLEDNDIKDEYVVTSLSKEQSSGECIDLKTIPSWNNSAESIYLCTDKNGNSNLSIVNQNDVGNLNYVHKQPYYFRGENVYNYAKLGTETYQILYIDIDDNIVLYNRDVTENMLQYISDLVSTPFELKSISVNMAGTNFDFNKVEFGLACEDGIATFSSDYVKSGTYGYSTTHYYHYHSSNTFRTYNSIISPIDRFDILNSISCSGGYDSWIIPANVDLTNGSISSRDYYQTYLPINDSKIIGGVCKSASIEQYKYKCAADSLKDEYYIGYKFKLNDSYNIESGVGTYNDPYVIGKK